MSYDSPKKLFPTAAMRNKFVDSVLAAFESAWGHAELICLYQEFEPKLNELRDKGGEYDVMAYDEVMARYKALHVRVDESREWVYQQVREYEERINSI